MKHRLTRPLLAATLLAAGTSFAGPAAPAPTGKSAPETAPATDPCESLWAWATLYKSDTNPFLQELALTGRYQGQFAAVDSDHGDADGWDNRRARLGFRAKVWKDFEVKNEYYFDLNNLDNAYGSPNSGITDGYIAWKPGDAFHLTVGKQKPKFSLDWTTSSREIITIERNLLINNIGIEYLTGVSVAGKQGNWSYYGGAFNNDVRDNALDESEFGDLDGAWSWIASLAYDLKDQTGLDKAVLRADYLHSDHDMEDDRLNRFDDSIALSFNAKKGNVGVITEVLWAEGDTVVGGTDADMWGFYVMPTYDISKKLQLVGRFTHAEGDNNTLQRQGRYERGSEIGGIPGTGALGDNYNAYYLGLNYYVCGHKLKFMSGLEYAEFAGTAAGSDNDSWTWVNGIRFYF